MKFNQYPEQTDLNQSDLILIWDSTSLAVKQVKLSTLKSFLGGTSSVPTQNEGDGTNSANQTQINFSNNGQYKGVCYYVATNRNTDDWENPHTNGKLNVSASSIEFGDVSQLVDRLDTIFYTPDVDGSWIKIDFLQGNSLQCNYYAIKSHNAGYQYHPRNFKLQGSNDDVIWTDLDIQINNSTLISSSQWLSLPIQTSVSYRYLRILAGQDSNGSYYFILGEIEFYGIYKYQN